MQVNVCALNYTSRIRHYPRRFHEGEYVLLQCPAGVRQRGSYLLCNRSSHVCSAELGCLRQLHQWKDAVLTHEKHRGIERVELTETD